MRVVASPLKTQKSITQNFELERRVWHSYVFSSSSRIYLVDKFCKSYLQYPPFPLPFPFSLSYIWTSACIWTSVVVSKWIFLSFPVTFLVAINIELSPSSPTHLTIANTIISFTSKIPSTPPSPNISCVFLPPSVLTLFLQPKILSLFYFHLLKSCSSSHVMLSWNSSLIFIFPPSLSEIRMNHFFFHVLNILACTHFLRSNSSFLEVEYISVHSTHLCLINLRLLHIRSMS